MANQDDPHPSVARLWGDLREFRGEMNARMSGVENQIRQLGQDLRDRDRRQGELIGQQRDLDRRMDELDKTDVHRRLEMLETFAKIVTWLGGVISLAVLGLIGEMVRTWFAGGGSP